VLDNRDGYVYVSVKRWDQDQSNSQSGSTFPNGHPLWQFSLHIPGSTSAPIAVNGLPQACFGSWKLSSNCSGTNCSPGFGLQQQTVNALGSLAQMGAGSGILPQDKAALASAFMLNDEGYGDTTGMVDNAAQGSSSTYSACLSWANSLLDNAPESHACAEYVASNNASQNSSSASEQPKDLCIYDPTIACAAPSALDPEECCPRNNPTENNYSIKFVDCNSVPGFTSQQDLTYIAPGAGG
jgi:hypothetical protein